MIYCVGTWVAIEAHKQFAMLDAFQDFFNKGAFGAVWIAAAKAFRADTTYIPTRVGWLYLVSPIRLY
ncbi:MAG: hypothetical protein ACOCX5_05415 [Chloroflexota bacterium]